MELQYINDLKSFAHTGLGVGIPSRPHFILFTKITNMYIIKIGLDPYNLTTAIVSSVQECFDIYWNYYNSVQAISLEFYVQCCCIRTFSFFDITKGADESRSCSSEPIKCTKNHSYIIDRAEYLKSL